ncbi:MAG: MarR family transcriptional regulator [Chloroflexaceae bacterium]|jgi:DNA-binding MarR family transcriptional regulator|nr:MarR family transcriptional regulator [Chloroflexaceae bacterium]
MKNGAVSQAKEQHRLIHELYVLVDDGDRQVLAEQQLSPLEFAVLQQLDADNGQRLTDVGALLLCVKSTITRVMDRLERDGLVLRTQDRDDRRAQRVVLTAKGVYIRNEAVRLHAASVESRMAVLTPAEQRQFLALAGRLATGLRDGLHPDGNGYLHNEATLLELRSNGKEEELLLRQAS